MVFAAAATASATTYTLTDLGILGGTTGNNSYAMGSTSSGVVAGAVKVHSGNARDRWPTIYSGGATGSISAAASTPGTAATIAGGINDNGQVAGFDAKDSFVYNIGTGTYTDIAAQPGAANGSSKVVLGADAYSDRSLEHDAPINGSGQSTGHYLDSSSNQDGFIWSGSSTINVPAPVGTLTFMSGINNSGVAVGNYQAGLDPTPTGFYYSAAPPWPTPSTTWLTRSTSSATRWSAPTMHLPMVRAGLTRRCTRSAPAAQDVHRPHPRQQHRLRRQQQRHGRWFSGSDAFVYSGGAMTDLNTLVQGGLGTFRRIECRLRDKPERGIHRRRRDHRRHRRHARLPADGRCDARAFHAAAGRKRANGTAGLRLEAARK